MTVTVGSMEALRAEHRTLLPHIDAMARVAREAMTGSPGVLRSEVGRVLAFMHVHLLPHAAAEDDVLYPAVERAMGASGATATMRREHVEVGRLVEELAAVYAAIDERLDLESRVRLTELLYSLHAVVALHFAKEEEIYVPLLEERLSVEDAHSLLQQMERHAQQHRLGAE